MRDGLNVFFDGRFRYFVYTSVMTEVNYLNSLGLKDPPHNIDGSIMSVEQGSSRNNSKALSGMIHNMD